MQGLMDDQFHQLLQKRSKFVYASPVTAEILKNLVPRMADNIKSLPLEEPTLVPVRDKSVCVTLLRAGHCPGSVMFLFEYQEKIVLYTGDYRIHKNDYKKFKLFKYPSGAPKHIDKIYLDTTFFKKQYPSFPSRDQCINSVCSIIREWIAKSKHHIVSLKTSATYGYESLFIDLSKSLGFPIHVSEREHKFYRCVPEMDKAVTLSNSTPLHNNCGPTFWEICHDVYSPSKIKSINFSAFWWTEDKLAENGGVTQEGDAVRVCYSTHASLEEGLALIRELKPDSVEPCVVPKGADAKEMGKLIESAVQESKRGGTVKEEGTEVRALFVVKEEGQSVAPECSLTPKFCSLLESPPRNSKRKKFSITPEGML